MGERSTESRTPSYQQIKDEEIMNTDSRGSAVTFRGGHVCSSHSVKHVKVTFFGVYFHTDALDCKGTISVNMQVINSGWSETFCCVIYLFFTLFAEVASI